MAQHPDAMKGIQDEVDAVCGDDKPSIEQLRGLKFTTRVVNESMRLYPQPPVLIRRCACVCLSQQQDGGRLCACVDDGGRWQVE